MATITREDQEFLNKLIDLAKTYGWSGDYHQVAHFVRWCHYVLGKPHVDDLNPYDTDIEVKYIDDIEHIECSGVIWHPTSS